MRRAKPEKAIAPTTMVAKIVRRMFAGVLCGMRVVLVLGSHLTAPRPASRKRRLTADHEVESLARHKKLVFQEDAVVVKLGVVDDLRHRAERVAPRVHLRRPWVVTVLPEERVLQLVGDPVVHRVADEVGREARVEAHGGGQCNRRRGGGCVEVTTRAPRAPFQTTPPPYCSRVGPNASRLLGKPTAHAIAPGFGSGRLPRPCSRPQQFARSGPPLVVIDLKIGALAPTTPAR